VCELTHCGVYTGHEKYKYLENLVFVSSGRAIVDEDGAAVEHKISQVVT
jgi:hypothetical protein